MPWCSPKGHLVLLPLAIPLFHFHSIIQPTPSNPKVCYVGKKNSSHLPNTPKGWLSHFTLKTRNRQIQTKGLKPEKSNLTRSHCRARLFTLIRYNFGRWTLEVQAGGGSLLRSAYHHYKTDSSPPLYVWYKSLKQSMKNAQTPRSLACVWSNSLGTQKKVPKEMRNSKHPWFPLIQMKSWHRRKHVSLIFVGPDPRSAASTFGHAFLVAHNEFPPEPDALSLEYIGITNNSLLLQAKALLYKIQGLFRLRYYQTKKLEYDMQDRSMWLYRLDKKTVKSLNSRILKSLHSSPPYQFMFHNCSDGIWGVMHGKLPFRLLFPDNLIPNKKNHPLHIPSSLAYARYLHHKLTPRAQNQFAALLKQNINIPSIGKLTPSSKNYLLKILPYLARRANESSLSNAYLTQFIKISKTLTSSKAAGQLLMGFPQKNPSEGKKRHSVSVQGGITHNSSSENKPIAYFSVRFAEFDFFTPDLELFKNSSIEFFKLQVAIESTRVGISQISLFKLDASEQPELMGKSFVRFADISYYDWDYIFPGEGQQKEYTAQYGTGFALPILGRRMNFSTLLAGGISLSKQFEGKKPQTYLTLSIRSKLNIHLTKNRRIELLHVYLPFAPQYYWKHNFRVRALLFTWSNYSLTLDLSSMSKNTLPKYFATNFKIGIHAHF